MSELVTIQDPSLKDLKKLEKEQRRKETIEKALVEYIDKLKGLETNIIKGIFIAGAREETPDIPGLERGAYIWNILAQDFEPGQSENIDYYNAGNIMSDFQRRVGRYVDIGLSYIEPSHIDELRRQCQEFKMETDEIYFY